MRAELPAMDVALSAFQLERSYGFDQVRGLRPSYAAATSDTVEAIVSEAAKFAATWLGPLNDIADREHCRVIDGRVRTAPGHREAWTAFVEAGWPTLDQPEENGGQGLPLALAAAVQEAMDRSCAAFGMLPVPQRSAARLIAAWGSEAIKAEWLPKLTSGEWGATICISEAEAGSDVGRIRTRAQLQANGRWAISGDKCWISFGDHDLTPRIGHCLLARTPRGLSLFLVPDTDEAGHRNGVTPLRVEHKLGLNGSPTCVLAFESAEGWLLGEEGRGLAQMFVMITNMRLSVGVQGLGLAGAAADTAWAYAGQRRQGGSPEASVTIDQHPDVRRMLLDMSARVHLLRGLIYALANLAEIGVADPSSAALAQWLLPIVKTLGGEVGFANADAAMQVLGGAGYTREWPVEQALRDARVLTIYEGTTGIQALDLLQRRLLKGSAAGYAAFVGAARPQADRCGAFRSVLAVFTETSEALIARAGEAGVEAGATAYLHLASLTALGWIAAEYTGLEGGPLADRLASTAHYWLHGAEARARMLAHDALDMRTALAQWPAARIGAA